MADSLRLRMNGERELLIEQAKELTGHSEASKAIDECIRRAISLDEIVENERNAIRERVRDLETEHHRMKVRTNFERRREKR